jgi:hypothetical protein
MELKRMNQLHSRECAENKALADDRPVRAPHLDYWLFAMYASFVAWLLHSYGVKFLFVSVHRLIAKFL